MITVKTTHRSGGLFTITDHETGDEMTLTTSEALQRIDELKLATSEALQLIEKLKDAYDRLRREEQTQGVEGG